jgi:hypothetical protein
MGARTQAWLWRALACALLASASCQNSTSNSTTPTPVPVPVPAPSYDVEWVAAWVFLDLAVIILVCRFVGIVFKACGQPAVIGEIIAGA